MLSPTRWIRVRELFDEALEQPSESRVAWVRQAVGPEERIGAEVLSLLEALDRARETLERPAAGIVVDSFVDSAEDLMVGRRVGAYDIVRLIGYGGMGAVYEGVRADDDFAKRVAIKFLRPGMGSDVAIRRFRYERQILASLNHKNIAGLHDGGVTPDGQPYFVMEYVEGTPITTYCAERRLGVRERVSLFRQVCAAVQHAHQQLVVHRDLKPGNILVTGDGTVKLLDFGIAKLLRAEEGPDQLPMTRGGVRVFTPQYASPEQVRGLVLAPASDIYSLGVILFELLAGRRPFNTDGKLLHEIEQEVCTVMPTRPSSMLAPEAADTFGVGEASRVRRRVAGDLDAIVLTTLAKEPGLRYGTAEQLNTDLRRWLDGHPVSARKTWMGYRFRKFVVRHRWEVVAGTLAVAALIGGIVSTSRQAGIARTEATKASEVNAFLADMLSAADPELKGRDVTVRQVLDLAAREVPNRKLEPEIEAQIRHTVAQTYYGLGVYDSAAVHAERAFTLRRQLFGLRHEGTLFSLSYTTAVAEALGAFVRAESLSRVAVDTWRTMRPARPTELANSLDMLARMIEHQGRLDEARGAKLESIAIRRTLTDSASRADLPYTLNNLAVSFMYAGQLDSAESLTREGLAIARETTGPESYTYAEMLKSVASVLSERGNHTEADSLIRESTRVMLRVLGPRHPNYLRGLLNEAQILYAAGNPAGALAAAEKVVPMIGDALPEADPTSAAVLQVQGLSLDSLKRFNEGEAPLRRSLELRRKYLPPDHWAIASAESVVGYHLGLVKRYPEGAAMMARAWEVMAASRGAESQVTRRVAVRLSELYGRWGRKADSVAWAARAK
ncbi:MAG: serine/threonine protein kinase [Cytophagaceae bacterium]|nr:serine/threonine protein kinase [Gemmatimonadaceae bacterium]